MVNTCSDLNCYNRSNRLGEKKCFFSIPSVISHQGKKTEELSRRRRALWLSRLNRSRPNFKPSRHTKICSDHFISGKPSTLYNELHPDWAPSCMLDYSNMKKFEGLERYNMEKILKRYDLVLIQEIRDASGEAIVDLFNLLNQESTDTYEMIIGSRQGRSSSKEQYCYFYKMNLFSVVAHREYPNSEDRFERTPFNVRFKHLGTGNEFVLSALHAKPDDAVSELDGMVDVYDDIVNVWQRGTPDVLMMGDFNADCSYVRSSDWNGIRLWTDGRFKWELGNEVDTTVSTTDCAYDRFVTSGSLISRSSGASVYNFEEEMGLSNEDAKDVSDHYPIDIDIQF